MNATKECTLRELLPGSFEGMREAVDEQIAADPELARSRLPRFVHKMIAAKATQAVLDKLNKNIFLIFPAAWRSAPELREYADKSKHPPEEESTLFLGEHKFDIAYSPIVNVRIAGLERPLLRFKLIISPQIRGASITVRNGYIVAIGECDCSVEAELKYLSGPEGMPTETGLHTKLKSRDVQLAEPLLLDPPGVQILSANGSGTAL